jgi:hypothetical protein
VVPHPAKKALSGIRSKHADEEENSNRHENPEFDQAWPQKSSEIRRLPTTIPIFSGDTFRRSAHGRHYFCKVRIRCSAIASKGSLPGAFTVVIVALLPLFMLGSTR